MKVLPMETSLHSLLREDGPHFVDRVFTNLDSLGLDARPFFMDHICYRTRSQAEYMTVKTELESIGTLLVESEIGGRLIATFKLIEALDVALPKKGVSVQLCVVEIPSPKLHSKRDYPAGLEHVEFVVPSLIELETRFPNLQWDRTGLKKDTNADLRLDFDGFSVKFHEQPLEKVIEQELLANRY